MLLVRRLRSSVVTRVRQAYGIYSVVIPALILASVNAKNLWDEHWEHWEHLPPLEERVEYPYMNIRTKAYPWGNGDQVSLSGFMGVFCSMLITVDDRRFCKSCFACLRGRVGGFQDTAAIRESEKNRAEVLEVGRCAKLLTVMF